MRYSEMMVNRMTEIIKYDEMKSTREQWLGEIPASWGTLRLKRIFTIKKDIAGEEGHTVLSVTQKGIRPKVMSEKGQFALDYSKYQLVNRGEFVMNHMDLLTGWVDISDYDGVTSPDYRVFVNSDPSKYDSSYYRYIFQLCYSARIFYGLGQGVAGFGRWRLPADMFLNFGLPVPPIGEQHSIAAYLDDRVSQIDSFIEDVRMSIEECTRWKASVINEAVTKGLDKSVPKKNSHIPWIGSIPSAWKLIKVKRVVRIENGSDPQTEGDIPVYGSGTGSFKTCGEYKEGPTVLLGRKGTLNIPHYIEGKYWNVDTAFNVVVKDDAINLKYFYYTAICFDYPAYSSQTTLPSMTQSNYNNMLIPYPSIDEQGRIVCYLDKVISEIDELINEKKLLIDDLEMYKRSLIYEAVTGKRKVV